MEKLYPQNYDLQKVQYVEPSGPQRTFFTLS